MFGYETASTRRVAGASELAKEVRAFGARQEHNVVCIVHVLARHAAFAAYTGLLVMLLICGCDRSGGRQAIEGTVTLDGKTLENGQITFVPQPGTQGPTAGAEIVGGKFSIPTAGGTFAGKFRVEVTASHPSGKKDVDRVSGKLVDIYEQFIPSRYNAESQLEAKVKAGEVNHFKFAVTSK